MQRGKFNLMTMLMIVGIVPLVALALLINIIVGKYMDTKLKHEVEIKLDVACEGMHSYYSEGWDVIDAEDFYYVDSLLEDDVELTLFDGDTRLISSIKDENNNRILGTKASDEVVEAVLVNGNDFFAEDVVINGDTYFAHYSPIEVNGEIVGMAFAGESVENVEKAVNNVRLYMLGISIITMATFAVVIVWVANCFKKPMQKVIEELKKIAEGNLDNEINIESRVKETIDLIESTKTIQRSLIDIVSKTKDSATDLVGRVNEVDELTETMNTAASQIGLAMDELATAAVSMAEDVQNVSSEVVVMGQNINNIAENVEELNGASKMMEMVSGQAEEFMTDVLTNSNKSVEAVMNISEQIDSTNESIKKINDAVAFIQDITSQTKLLSLNASIEAARAGEAGRGFSVVAENIRQLSEQSSQGANKIKEIAEEIFGQFGKSTKLAEDIKEIINDEQVKISETQKCFMELKEEIEKSVNEIKAIGEKTVALDESKGNIIDKVESLSAISEENAASNQEVTASIQTMVDDIHTVSNDAVGMKSVAGELEQAISVFKLQSGKGE